MIKGVKSRLLSRGSYQSQHLVEIRDHESPHIHRKHDLTVFFLEGRGTLLLKGRRIPVRKGDTAFIPKGAAHHYINKGRRPTLVYAVFSPAFDGKDTIPAA